ncbi:hypothetical protein ACROYT_G019040 [Oculina patagonica]
MFSIQRPEVPLLEMVPVPKAPWFLAVYVRDVMSGLDELNARITSTFGSILKLDSTKSWMLIFNFSLQVDERRKQRCVCFDPSKQKVLKGYEESREAVKFVNFGGKYSGGNLEEQIVLTKRSRIEPANNNDIALEYDEVVGQEVEGRFTEIGSVKWLAEGEVISVKGQLSVCVECV